MEIQVFIIDPHQRAHAFVAFSNINKKLTAAALSLTSKSISVVSLYLNLCPLTFTAKRNKWPWTRAVCAHG